LYKSFSLGLGCILLSTVPAVPLHAQKAYDPGVSDKEIKLGQSTPLSGPASAFGAGAGRVVIGYFEMINEQGGINGHKISFTQLDNAYSAPKAVEQSRKLVEDVEVFAEVGTIGTVPNVAIGLEASKGLVTTQFLKQPGDPVWTNDDEVLAYKKFLRKYAPSTNPDDYSVLVAYMNVHGVTLALKKCGEELTRTNLIRQATSLQGDRLPMMLPGVTITTKPDDNTPFKTLRIASFDGVSWALVGDPLSAD